MSIVRCVTIIGDSNVKRHMNSTNCRDRPQMLETQVIQCGRLATLATSMKSIRAESNVCVLSCVSNFLTSLPAQNSSSLSVVVEPIFKDFLAKLIDACQSRPETSFLICPPMYRTNPIWYREGLPEILRKFSEMMKARPSNSHMMPSFPSPSYDPDGVHLTAYSGLEYVLHMFDSIRSVLDSLLLDPESKSSHASESSRVLEDRVMVLEQDHRRLNDKFEHKYAVDAELSDFQENLRNEAFLMVRGLARLPKLDPKEWQVRTKSDVQAVFSLFMNKECPVSYVMISTGRGKDSIPQYKVRLPTAELSKEIRDRFALFIVGGDKRPPALKRISIRNCVTQATLGRISILQLLGRRYKDSNPGSKYTVVGYEARPLLKITPSSDASDSRTQTYNFIEAIEKLPTCFSGSEIDDLLERLSPKLHGRLKSLFVVVSDDMLKKRTFLQPKSKSSKQSKSAKTSSASKGKAPSNKSAEESISGSESSSSFKTPPNRKRNASGHAHKLTAF